MTGSYRVNKHVFKLYKDLTEPCPCCGIPACGREYFLWYKENEDRISVMFDGGELDGILENYLHNYWKGKNVNDLPIFIRDWICDEGWQDCDSLDGTPLIISDLRQALGALCESTYNETHKYNLHAILSFIDESEKNNVQLRITKT